MSSKEDRTISRCLIKSFLSAVIIYLFFIAYNHPQETREALILAFLCASGVVYLEIWVRLRGRLHTVLSICLVVVTAVFVSCEFCIAMGSRNNVPEDLRCVDYILILGNKLEPEGLSDVLKARLDKAVELSRYLNTPIIVSGGNSAVNDVSEASKMKEYLVGQGIQNDILLEEKALDTRHNFLYTAELIGTESQLVVVTSELHLFRAKMLAKVMGYTHVYGIGAKTKKEMYLYYNLREVVAILRELCVALLMRY